MKRTLTLPVSIFLMYALATALCGPLRNNLSGTKEGADIIQRIFGGMRSMVGDWAFMKAEEYHHRGLPFVKALAFHEGESLVSERAGSVHEGAHEDKEIQAGEAKGLYSKIYSAVKVTRDSHLNPAEEKEVLPWFYVETAFSPHDVRGYVLGGYWLKRMGRLDESLKFLKAGEKNNPDAASIAGAIGWSYYIKKDFPSAIDYLERARRLWMAGKPPNEALNRYDQSERYFDLELLGEIYEKAVMKEPALKVYQELYDIDPNSFILKKVNKLKALQGA